MQNSEHELSQKEQHCEKGRDLLVVKVTNKHRRRRDGSLPQRHVTSQPPILSAVLNYARVAMRLFVAASSDDNCTPLAKDIDCE